MTQEGVEETQETPSEHDPRPDGDGEAMKPDRDGSEAVPERRLGSTWHGTHDADAGMIGSGVRRSIVFPGSRLRSLSVHSPLPDIFVACLRHSLSEGELG